MKVCLAGEGAQGFSHYETLSTMDDVEVVSLAGGLADDAEAFAAERGIPHWSLDLEECLRQPGVEACILTTPNAIHAAQAELCMSMGKHVLIEIPMGMTLAESERLAGLEQETGLVCMVCHSQRYGSGHREVKRRVQTGELRLHHIVQQTYFMRRIKCLPSPPPTSPHHHHYPLPAADADATGAARSENRFGTPRTWTDDLLWHQLCHAIDMCYWILDDPELEGFGQAGPDHPTLGCVMDITVGLRSPRTGAICSLAASFNNHGPITSEYRFIGEEDTISGVGGQLTDSEGEPVEAAAEFAGSGGDDLEFLHAIRVRLRAASARCSSISLTAACGWGPSPAPQG